MHASQRSKSEPTLTPKMVRKLAKSKGKLNGKSGTNEKQPTYKDREPRYNLEFSNNFMVNKGSHMKRKVAKVFKVGKKKSEDALKSSDESSSDGIREKPLNDPVDGASLTNFEKENASLISLPVPDKQKQQVSVLETMVQQKMTHDSQVVNMIEQALKFEATAPYGRSKLMVVGEGRAGKTSTIKRLLGKGFNPNLESTKGFDLHRVDASNWEERDTSYLVEHLQNVINVVDIANKTKHTAKSGILSKYVNTAKTLAGTSSSSRSSGSAQSSDSSKHKSAAALLQKTSLRQKKTPVSVVVSKEEVKQYSEEFIMAHNDHGRPFGFSIWDFGGQKVFYTLHHMFLTSYGCYLLVFDPNKVLNKETRKESINYMKFWMFSKKLHALTAPVLIVASHCDGLTEQDLNRVEKYLVHKVLKHDTFNEVRNGHRSFFAVDNASGTGIIQLRTKIEQVVSGQAYLNDQIPISFLRLYEKLMELKVDYLKTKQVRSIAEECKISEELFMVCLKFLNHRGLITFFDTPRSLSKFVILQPQWLIEGITDVIFDQEEHHNPIFGDEFNSSFRRFLDERVISQALLKNIWTLKGYALSVQSFFMDVMLKTSLACEYNFDNDQSYLVPSLISSGLISDASTMSGSFESGSNFYTGRWFVLDFSGEYDEAVVNDDGKKYVRFLPFGVFERLICMCVEHSGKLRDSIKPVLTENYVRMSFGVDVDFEIRKDKNPKGEFLWIVISTEEGTSLDATHKLIKLIYSMIEAIKKDFFSKQSETSLLSMTLLLPSSVESGEVLADFNLIKSRRNDKLNCNKKFRPGKRHLRKISPHDYDVWFVDTQLEANVNECDSVAVRTIDFTNPNAQFESITAKDPTLTSMKSHLFKPLKNALEYHCFLSYKQSSAIDLVGKQYYILSQRGYKCWYDQQFQGQITLENMREGVKKSMAYILILSKDIFPSYYVEEEVKMATSLRKPIILLHHPSTGEMGYWQFSDYINKAPDVLKPIFAQVESIQLQRRHFLEEAVTEVLDRRLQEILNMSK